MDFSVIISQSRNSNDSIQTRMEHVLCAGEYKLECKRHKNAMRDYKPNMALQSIKQSI